MTAKTSKKGHRGSSDPLECFDHRIRHWFLNAVGKPSAIQDAAWPRIATGSHLLMTAPTGSGKTLAAFLWALNQLLSGTWSTGRPRVLYVSPLKALNTDVRRNLLAPLEALAPLFTVQGKAGPTIRVLTRSGDTTQSDRRRMLRQPPEILITTPESLNLMLNSRGGQSLLGGLKTVILDEIHAVAGTKRGTHLICAVERLVALSGEFQRVAISATVKPLDAVAEFIGGYVLQGAVGAPEYTRRPVELIQGGGHKHYQVGIHYPDPDEGQSAKEGIWAPLADRMVSVANRNRSTLVFTNSRKLSEKMAYLVNAAAGDLMAYAHHGSLAQDLRRQVEARLKRGELKAVIATSSLELGIDIGDLDEVVLLQTPPTISSGVQRAGRAGHQVGVVSKTSIYCTHPGDLVPAAVMGRAIVTQDIEPLQPTESPLDVLAQVIVGMVALEAVDRRELYLRIRCAAPYHRLTERQFDLVLEMLAGRYAHTRLRALKPRVDLDSVTGTVKARRGALQALYLSGGTIPDRGYYTLRHHQSGARIGELDEEFVWEAKTGQTFTLGTQNWQIRKITPSDVLVRPAPGRRVAPPFWRADGGGREAHFATRIAEFLEWINDRLDAAEIGGQLEADFGLDAAAAEHLLRWLKTQRHHTGCDLPHRHHLVAERIHSGPGGAPGSQLALHLPWGGRLTWPLALALEAALEATFGQAPEVFAGDDIVLLVSPPDIGIDQLLALVTAERLLPLLRKRLERSGYFGARFRTAAGRALLIARGGWGRRMPLWMTRLNAQKLLAAVMPLTDFPLLLEAWRSCLQDGFDLPALASRLAEVASGAISVSEVSTRRPSPMAQAAAWGQINEYMYRDDSARDGGRSELNEGLLREVVFSEQLRPPIAPSLVTTFEAKRQRTAQGYSPDDAMEVVAWVRERLLLRESEWKRLLEGIQRDHGDIEADLLRSFEGRLVYVRHPAARERLMTTADMAALLIAAFWPGVDDRIQVCSLAGVATGVDARIPDDPPPAEALLAQWLSYYGPLDLSWLQATLGLDARHLGNWVDGLEREERLVRGTLLEGEDTTRICDAENYEILLRMGRHQRRDPIRPLALTHLPQLLARHQGIVGANGPDETGGDREADAGVMAVRRQLSRLAGWPTAAAHWEADILPVRVPGYRPGWLDAVLQEGELIWLGCGKEQLTFCYADELDLLGAVHKEDASEGGLHYTDMSVNNGARYPFAALASGRAPGQTYKALWEAVWDGKVVNDSYQSVRQGLANRFEWPGSGSARNPYETAPRPHRRRRAGRRPRQLQVPGNWYQPFTPEEPGDELASLELDKERVRLLLERYGLLFKSLLSRESGPFAWGRLFRAMRIMELAGEVVGGHFVDGLPGPQFASPRMLNVITQSPDPEAIFYLNATDPACICGLGVQRNQAVGQAVSGGEPAMDHEPRVDSLPLPSRRSTTHLVYHGNRLVLVSRRRGRRLTFNVEHDDRDLKKYLILIDHLLMLRSNNGAGVVVDTINGQPAPQSPYLATLKTCFEVMVDPNRVTVYAPWTSSV